MDRQRQSPLGIFLILLFGLYSALLIIYLILRVAFGDSQPWLTLFHTASPYYFLPLIVGLIVGLVFRAKRFVALQLILLTIGIAWIGVPLLPRALPPQQGTALSLLTFNVYPENDDVQDAIRYIISRDPDVVVLQETSASQDWSDLLDYYPHARFNGSYGLYSRYAISENTTIELSAVSAQRALLEVDDENVVLYNVHLTFPFDSEADAPLLLRYDESVRNADIEALLALLDEETDNEVIVAGDFNLSDYSPAYDRLTSTLTDAYRAGAWGLGATWPAAAFEEADVPAWVPRLFRLDYVFHSEDINTLSAIVGPRIGSDHLPVLVTLDIDD